MILQNGLCLTVYKIAETNVSGNEICLLEDVASFLYLIIIQATPLKKIIRIENKLM